MHKNLIFFFLIIYFSALYAQDNNISYDKNLTSHEKYDLFISLLKKDCACGVVTGFIYGNFIGGISPIFDIMGCSFYALMSHKYRVHDNDQADSFEKYISLVTGTFLYLLTTRITRHLQNTFHY